MAPDRPQPPASPGSPADASGDVAHDLVQRLRAGDRRALARAITLVEDRDTSGIAAAAELYAESGSASLVGVTGAPGVGKSTLVGALVGHLRSTQPDTAVGVVAVDPSSPFTHGALLGDRIRLADHFLDPGVFIRSMGTRGHLGGLAQATAEVARLMDACGMREIFIETVGVGQSEIEIAGVADTVLLVLMPGSGDSVQALKAGIMEIPDIVVINKADHPAARSLHQHVRSILMLDREREWMPPIVETQAVTGNGIERLWHQVHAHREFLASDGRLERRRRERVEHEVFSLVATRALGQVRQRVEQDDGLRSMIDALHERKIDPQTCTARLFQEVFGA